MVLQPEGIRFVEADFEGPMGPGNALAVALRATREYLLSKRDFDPQRDGEPYPLLLVRPDGIAAYYAARAALQSWATEFGYELIDADWKLAYQAADTQLAEIVRQVVASARVRQERLIAAAPAAYAKEPRETYRASSTRGGFVREGGSDNDEREERGESGFQPRPHSGRIGGRRGSWGDSGDEGGSTGSTEAEQVASLYGNAGGGTPDTVGQAGASVSSGAGAFTSGGGGIGNASGQGTTAGAYGAGSGNAGGGVGGGANVSSINAGSSNVGSGNLGSGYAGSGYAGSGQGNVLREATDGVAGTNGMRNIGAGSSDMMGIASNGSRPAAAGQGASNGPKLPENYNTVDGGQRTGDSGQQTANSGQGNSGHGAAYSGQRTGDSGQGIAERGSGGPAKLPEGYIVGQPPSEQPQGEQPSQATDQETMVKRAMPLRPGEWQPHERPPLNKPPDEKAEEKKTDRQAKDKHQRSLAAKRGRDWGLPDAAGGSVPITRPIRIECRADQLVIVPEEGLSGGKTIPLGNRTSGSIEAFISAIWEHMETWGIAGRGMYWRPILNVYVAPGAEQRFADLQMLLEGSGVKIVRR